MEAIENLEEQSICNRTATSEFREIFFRSMAEGMRCSRFARKGGLAPRQFYSRGLRALRSPLLKIVEPGSSFTAFASAIEKAPAWGLFNGGRDEISLQRVGDSAAARKVAIYQSRPRPSGLSLL